MTPPLTDYARLETVMKKLSDFIMEAEAAARDGKVFSMSKLDRDVAIICSQALALPPERIADIQPLMAELIGNLERLSRELEYLKENKT